jgi:hypothetical protein
MEFSKKKRDILVFCWKELHTSRKMIERFGGDPYKCFGDFRDSHALCEIYNIEVLDNGK